MPGITGIISRHPLPSVRAERDTMTRALMHESFYRSGTWTDEALGVWIGWAVASGSFADCLPIWNETHDVCLIFSGEVFTDHEVLDNLRRQGHEFIPNDASHLVHWYEEIGLVFLEKLNGLFCGVLVDLRRQIVVLFNDRYGMNRIYWHENEYSFYFSSEAKSLLHALPATRELDKTSASEFFASGCVLQNRTLFSRLRLLPGASNWIFSPDNPVERRVYFAPRAWETQPELSAADYYDQLRSTWLRLLPRYFDGRQATALSLTGGVDSRMILACAQRPAGSLPCYTFGGPYRHCADVTVSKRVATVCGQPHQTIDLGHEFLANFPELVERSVYLTDGTLDPTGAADLYVNRLARNIAPVRVTGLNGGEILRRQIMFKTWCPRNGLLDGEFKAQVTASAQTYARELRGHPLTFIAFKQSPWHLYPRLAVERSQLTLRSPYFDNDLIGLAYQAPPETRDINPALRIVAEQNPDLGAIATDRAIKQNGWPLFSALRHGLQEFTFKAEYAYDYGMPPWLARLDHQFRDWHLERLFLGRHKFYHFRVWYRDWFAGYLREILLDRRARSRSYLNGPALERMVLGHVSGKNNFTLELHRVLTLELAQRRLIETA